MTELRRLLVDKERLENLLNKDDCLVLNNEEKHYLSRVLRLRHGNQVSIVDGFGSLWTASLEGFNSIQLTSTFDKPLVYEPLPRILVCLAVVLPKRGFEDVLRMGCEIGVDVFQPLSSEHRVSKGGMENRQTRWTSILREAMEQSERLWMPELRKTIEIKDWLMNLPSQSAYAVATTRLGESIEFTSWLKSVNQEVRQIWVLIGPEGGWSNSELQFALDSSCERVTLGKNILRTSTASIAASQLMVSWRRIKTLF
tara:strand:- start:713 stop:1477 length:765 start_codon:yes stop_codon:yes gene_type:complete